jgi:phage gp16-like protein
MTAQRKPKAPAPAQYAPKPKQPNYIAAIHVAQGKLRLTEDDARSLKLAVIGVESSKDMTSAQQAKLLQHLNKLVVEMGSRVTKDSRWRKARATWHALHRTGKVQVDTDRAMHLWIKRETGVDHWLWLSSAQVNTVIESLKKWLAR